MQSVSAAFTAESQDSVRSITENLLVSWKLDSTLGNRTFTIGVSAVGRNDVIGINPGTVGSPGNYKYFDETAYLMSLAWEHGLNIPTGGLSKGMAEAYIDNTSGRFTPRYMGGNSELFTSILPRRPFIINAGFEVDGIPQNIPQFSGILTRQPKVDDRSKTVQLVGADYIDFFQNRYLDQEVMFTGQRTDQVYETLLVSMGLSTAQYELDTGINIIPFGLFEKGSLYSNIFHQLAEAENGQFYQDEQGVFRFENRQHWYSSPHDTVSAIVLTGQVIEAVTPDEDNIINVVEISSNVRAKQPRQVLFQLAVPMQLAPGERKEFFIDFEDPVLEVDTINITSNTQEDGEGSAGDIYVHDYDVFAKAMKVILKSTNGGFVTALDVFGRPARLVKELYLRSKDDSSVTAYQERKLRIDNDYIQDDSWANSYAQMLLEDYSDVENLQRITIRAIPQLQIGDLISWRGRHWRVFDIKNELSPSSGYTQELTMLQRDIVTYFRIGFSTIGGSDKIAP